MIAGVEEALESESGGEVVVLGVSGGEGVWRLSTRWRGLGDLDLGLGWEGCDCCCSCC